MSQSDESQLYVCKMLNYASKHGEIFTLYYPREWIDQDLENNCQKCKTFGSWQGYRIARCTDHCENGCGMIDVGVEYNVQSPNSATNTYLKDVNWRTELGDIDFGETHKQMQAVHPMPERREYKGEWYIIDRSQCPYTMTKEFVYTGYVNPTIPRIEPTYIKPSLSDETRLYNNILERLTPLRITNAQSASPCSLITADFVGVLNVQRCEQKLTKELEDEMQADAQAREDNFIQCQENRWFETKVQEYQDEEQEKPIEIFKMENGIETKWFEIKIHDELSQKCIANQSLIANRSYDYMLDLSDDEDGLNPNEIYVPAISINQHMFQSELDQLKKDAARFRQETR
jgi:hypothetical protein